MSNILMWMTVHEGKSLNEKTEGTEHYVLCDAIYVK